MLLIHVITESQTFVVEFDLMDTFERKSSLQKKKKRNVLMHMNWVGIES